MRKVIKFGAEWCSSCKILSKTLEDIKTDVTFEEINIDEKPEITRQYDVRGVPTMIMIEDEVVLKRMSGSRTKQELEKWLNS